MRFAARVIAGVVLVFVVTTAARAAEIITVVLAVVPADPQPSFPLTLTVNNYSSRDLGTVTLVIGDTVTDFTPSSLNPAISPAGTMFLEHPLPGLPFDALAVTNLPGLSIAPAHAVTLLGLLGNADGALPLLLPGGPPLFSAALLDLDGTPIVPETVAVDIPANGRPGSGYEIDFYLPEPALPGLLLMALTPLLSRRQRRE